jgi:hypothetical protein
VSKCPDWLKEKILKAYPNGGEVLCDFASFIIDELIDLEVLEVKTVYEPATDCEETLALIKRWNRWADLERMYFTNLVKASKGNVTAAAHVAGVCKATVNDRINEFNLRPQIEKMREERKKLIELERKKK